jgi:phosphoadenosine phosphosulfate reductase
MIGHVCPEMPVIFVDTGFHFPETLAFRDALVARFGLNLVVVRPELSREAFLRQHGREVCHIDPDLCCYVNKVQPMQRALDGMVAWVAGVRRDQTRNRRSLGGLAPQISGVIKVHPLLEWTRAQVEAYRREHDLPAHPLYGQGYLSVGCEPCTLPVCAVEDERAGRWAGTGKRECGLHLDGAESGER